jgi:DNA-binding response OmpR family regulator
MEGTKAKILLCEDDQNLGSVLKNYLELNEYDWNAMAAWVWPLFKERSLNCVC